MSLSNDTLVLATRKSPLAIKQAEWVADLIKNQMGKEVDLMPMSTTGDRQDELVSSGKRWQGVIH